MKQYDNNKKVEKRDLEEVLSFYIVERRDAGDGWCIKVQNWYRKG